MQNKRNPYADCGLLIAISVLIIMIIKCCLFDITWVALLWIILCIVYCFLSYKYDSESKVIKHTTTAFLSISAITFLLFTIFDVKEQPKMNAFEGAKIDTVAEEEFIIKDDPIIKELIEDTISIKDTLKAHNDSTITSVDPLAPSTQESEAETTVDPTATDEEPAINQ